MKLRLVTEEIEIPDEAGKALLNYQKGHEGQCLIEKSIKLNHWWYDVEVPAVFEEIKDA